MNRALVFGLAAFLVVVSVAVLSGGSSVVLAGHGCHGCDGCSGDSCCGPAPCSGDCNCGGGGLFSRLRSRGCCGEKSCCAPSCCAPAACTPSCAAPASPMNGGQDVPPSPMASKMNRSVRSASFVR